MLDTARHDRSPLDGRRPEPVSVAHPEVHQATGMVSVQLGVTAAVALIRLRAYAYAHDVRLADAQAGLLSMEAGSSVW
jgi:hypothetical protein